MEISEIKGNLTVPKISKSGQLRKVMAGLFSAVTAAMFPIAGMTQSCVDPDALTFAMVPTEETVAELELYKPVIDKLEAATGKPVQFFMPTSYASVVEGMVGEFVNVAVLGPSSYVTANRLDPKIEVFATYAKRPGTFQAEGPGYQAVLVSRSDSSFDSIASLEGALVGLTDPGSTSGELLPRVVFTKEIGGVPLEEYFSKTVYTGSHELSAVAVAEGKVDAAFIATHRLDNVVNKGDVKAEDFQIIWSSSFVPQDPFVYRTDLCQDLRDKISSAFLSLSMDDPDSKEFLDNVKANKFVSMTSEDYDLIRDLQAAKKAAKN